MNIKLSMCLALGIFSASDVAAQSTTGLGRTGRWFTYDGQPTYLVGFDSQELVANPAIDYVAALDQFALYRINKVRIWAYCYWDAAGYIHPWSYSGGASGQFNLDQWNAAYWTRLRDFVAKARDRKIVVEVSVFAAYPAWPTWWTSTSSRYAFNKAYNVNGAFSANASGHFSPQHSDLNLAETSSSGKRLRDYQQALVDKVVAEIGSYDNVYLEIMNEFGADGTNVDTWHPWQLNWAQRIDATTSRLVSAHAGSPATGTSNDGTSGTLRPQHYWDKSYVDVMNFRFFNPDNSPQGVSNWLNPSQLRGKILTVNESNNGTADYANDLDGQTRYAWALFLAGGHMGFYEEDSRRIGSSAWVAAARRLQALRDISGKVRFWELSPVDASGAEYDGLVTQGPAGSNRQVLANPGSQYLAYFWGSQSATSVQMQLPAGTYAYEWYDARDASLRGSGTATGGAAATIPAPAASGWSAGAGLALVVKATAQGVGIPANLSPNGTAFIAGTRNVTLSWSPVSGAARYLVRADFSGSTPLPGNNCSAHYLCVDNVTAASYSLPVQDGVAYSWWVHAVDSSGNMGQSASAVFSVAAAQVLDTQAPSIPAGLSAQAASSSQINLTWNASTDNVGVTGYKIFRAGTQIATTAGTSYSNTGLTASTAYSYTVAAYDAAGNTSGQSAATSATTPAAVVFLPPTILSPANGAALADGTNKVTVSWAAAAGVTGYAVRMADNEDGVIRDSRNTSGCAYVCIDDYAGTQITVDVRSGHTYRFWIHSRSGSGAYPGPSWSSSNAVDFSYTYATTPDAVAPTVPAGLSAQAASSSQINLTWNASTDNVGVTGYKIFRGGTQIATTAGTSYSNTGLTASTAYSYTVAAYDAAGYVSAQSVAASATTQPGTALTCPTPANPDIYVTAADFSGVQGCRQWSYRDSTGASMSFDAANNRWQGSETYLWLYVDGGHPGNGPDAVRRWTASAAGSIRITGNVSDADGSGGDGVAVSIKKGATALYQQTIVNGNATGVSYDVTTSVVAGDTIDFTINKIANNSNDATNFNPTITFTPAAPAPTCSTVGSNAFVGCYYGDMTLGSLKVSRTDPRIDFNWGTGSPDAGMAADGFSARWQGNFTFSAGDHVFSVTADDGVRLYVDGVLLIDQWITQYPTTYQATKMITAGTHAIKVEYFENTGGAVMQASWAPAAAPAIATDLNGDGATTVTDVQLGINQALGVAACTSGDVNKDGACNVMDVQRVVNAALGL